MKRLWIKLVLMVAVMFGVTASLPMGHTNSAQAATIKASKVVSKAKSLRGTRYRWGGTTPAGFDCSGFTKYVYKKAAKKTLPRTAQAQYNHYQHVSAKHLKKGDLVFFGGNKRSISHVGLYVGNGQMIDAQSRGVVTESIHAPWWHAVGYARVANLK
ncbi:C40 family peptidase [Levilactobacillus bambusae]|uniref:Hydrolase n=1 Tax=Levilactobacillus bambusae TaxID=2024736 RepID=A0A2V1MZG7_9LACO|nr:NlpC/P60 family protein [Levilactobacillus bambusae]PWF99887.1 hydrolase [Levilactobacillus bambusae]